MEILELAYVDAFNEILDYEKANDIFLIISSLQAERNYSIGFGMWKNYK